jgi:hypothetical protein
MWDVPYFQLDNILAVGITTTDNTVHNRKWFTKIEKSSYSPDLNFNRGIFYDTCKEVMIADEGIEVLGTMGINQLHINNDIQHIKFCTCVEKLQLR